MRTIIYNYKIELSEKIWFTKSLTKYIYCSFLDLSNLRIFVQYLGTWKILNYLAHLMTIAKNSIILSVIRKQV